MQLWCNATILQPCKNSWNYMNYNREHGLLIIFNKKQWIHSSNVIQMCFSVHLCMLVLQRCRVEMKGEFCKHPLWTFQLYFKIFLKQLKLPYETLDNFFCDFHILCIVNKIGKMSWDNMYHMLIHNSECVQYLCKLLKAQNTALCWRKYIRILYKIGIAQMDILWLMAKLASEIWTQTGGHCTLSE